MKDQKFIYVVIKQHKHHFADIKVVGIYFQESEAKQSKDFDSKIDDYYEYQIQVAPIMD